MVGSLGLFLFFHSCSGRPGTKYFFLTVHYFFSFVSIREIREGWLLLTVETEVNGDTKSANERGPSLVGFGGFVVPVKETPALGRSGQASTKYFTLFPFMCLLRPVTWAGRRAGPFVSE